MGVGFPTNGLAALPRKSTAAQPWRETTRFSCVMAAAGEEEKINRKGSGKGGCSSTFADIPRRGKLCWKSLGPEPGRWTEGGPRHIPSRACKEGGVQRDKEGKSQLLQNAHAVSPAGGWHDGIRRHGGAQREHKSRSGAEA